MKEMIETMPRIELALIIIGVLFTRTSRENDKGLVSLYSTNLPIPISMQVLFLF